MNFLNCVIYLLLSGLVIFLIGRIFPRRWIYPDKYPFKSLPFERQGRIYERLKIKRWKAKLPDASRILGKLFPWLMPVKKLEGNSAKKVAVLCKETCVAEMTHTLAALTGFFCVRIWKNSGFGVLISVANALWHLPFIMIQRYNRPRFLRTMKGF